jgi:protein-glutamine gamma-glutamyltransferase
MSFDAYFLLSSYAFAASGFAALVLTGRVDVPTAALYLCALGGSWYLESRRPGRLLELKRARLLAAAYIPLMILDALAVSPPFLVLTHFVLYMSAVKLFQRKQDADWIWVYVLSFFQVALAAALTVNLSFLLSLAWFLFTFVTTLAAFEVRRSHRSARRLEEETHASRGDRPRPLARVRSLMAVAAGQVVLVAVVAVPIFFFMPRFAGGALGGAFAEAQGITGFSDTVELGDVTNIQQSERPVMHVTLGRDPGRWLRWRGIALETFDGTRWSAANAGRAGGGDRTRSARYSVGALARSEHDLISQTIILEGIDSSVLFAARRAVALDGSFASLTVDRSGTIRGPNHAGKRLTYTAYSDLRLPSAEQLAADVSTAYPRDVAALDLQLPGALDPRLGELAHGLTDGARSPYEKARRLEAFFKENFAYSLSPRREDLSLDPVADFALNTREGHCELFATAMVLMLRAEGVPARLVNGFQMGELNDITNTYRVRERDAHSWVEVYFAANETWVEFDPTPPGGINSYASAGLAARLRQSLEAVQLFWIRYVVGLDDREQVSILRGAQSGFTRVKDWLARTAAEWKAWGKELTSRAATAGALERQRLATAAAAVAALGVLAFALFVLHGRGWSVGGFVVPVWLWRARLRGANAPPQRQAVLFYRQMTSLLARHGLARGASETPREFADRCDIDEVRTITEFYHRARFGGDGQAPSPEVGAALGRLSVKLRARRASARGTSSAAGRGGSGSR